MQSLLVSHSTKGTYSISFSKNKTNFRFTDLIKINEEEEEEEGLRGKMSESPASYSTLPREHVVRNYQDCISFEIDCPTSKRTSIHSIHHID
jgi:hypothetical protein